jgi:hypothetical protein
MVEHLASSAPVSLEDFIKVKPGRREKVRSMTFTTEGSRDAGSEKEESLTVAAQPETQNTSIALLEIEPPAIWMFSKEFIRGIGSRLEASNKLLRYE